MRSVSTAVVKHNPKSAKVNLMNAAQAEDSSNVIMGNLPVNDIPARVLFDTGASLSFLSKPFASMHDVHTIDLPKPIAVSSPGLFMNTKMLAPDVTITLGDYKFFLLQWFLATRILILFLGWIGFLSTRRILIVQPGRFN